MDRRAGVRLAWRRAAGARWAATLRARHGARFGSDTGGVTITTCLALLAVLAVTVSMAQIGVAVVARHRMQAAADLGALAAAGGLAGGGSAGCTKASDIVRRMGGRLVECVPADWDVTVTTEGRVSLGPLGARVVYGVARAGPADWELREQR